MRAGDLATALGARIEGDPEVEIARPVRPQDAERADDLALAMAPRHLDALPEGVVRAALIAEGMTPRPGAAETWIVVPRPRLALAGVTRAFDAAERPAPGVHETAVVEAGARLGEGVHIGPFSHIGAGAEIGDGVAILGQATVGEGARIGAGGLVHQGARLGPRVRLGARVIVHYNVAIGADGFSFVTESQSVVEAVRGGHAPGAAAQGPHIRIHSLAAVRIGDDVEIGANACVDRGTIADTTVGRGTKIDNLVTLGHNVAVGEDCLICGQAGIAGSARIGNRVVIGGKAGIGDHVTIGDDTIVAASAAVGASAPANSILMGAPALAREDAVELFMNTRRLPRMLRDLAALKAWMKRSS